MADEWAVRVAGHEVQIRDLPVKTLADIAKKTEVSWLMLEAAPLIDLNAAQAVLEAVCKQEGVECPTNLTGRTIVDYFAQVKDSPNGADTTPAASETQDAG